MAGATFVSDNLQTPSGVFRPIGWVMVGLPTQTDADALERALRGAGWEADNVRHVTRRETTAELAALVDTSSALPGLASDITLLRCCLARAGEGCRWLLVRVDGSEQAEAVATSARVLGATLAVHYRTLTAAALVH